MSGAPGFRFSGFHVSRRRRQVFREGVPVPLIPRYFDLLVLLIERRPAVVTRRDIFDIVWGDVFVSDGALTQAIRTLRRALGDDPRTPVFIRTASRHGYAFVHAEVVETSSDEEAPAATPSRVGPAIVAATSEAIPLDTATLVDRLVGRTATGTTVEERREAAQQLHVLGTAAALAAVLASPAHAEALALLRDTRWDVPTAGPVPLWGQSEGWHAARTLVAWRLRDAMRLTGRRWLQAAIGAAIAGAAGGIVGGALLVLAPASQTPLTAVPVLVLLGAMAGFAGAAGVAAGMAGAEAVARSRRAPAVAVGGALGGLVVGGTAARLVSWTLASLFGVALPLEGTLEGVAIGGAVGAGYAWATRSAGNGIPAPRGTRRLRVALTCAIAGGVAAGSLSLGGRALVGGVIHQVAQAFQGSQVSLAPLGAWIGEPVFGPMTQLLVGALEGALFGAGLAWGLTRRA